MSAGLPIPLKTRSAGTTPPLPSGLGHQTRPDRPLSPGDKSLSLSLDPDN